MHQPYTFRLTAQSELSFNLTYEGYACGAFNQKCFSILKFSDIPSWQPLHVAGDLIFVILTTFPLAS
jgi:hypothetical protein